MILYAASQDLAWPNSGFERSVYAGRFQQHACGVQHVIHKTAAQNLRLVQCSVIFMMAAA